MYLARTFVIALLVAIAAPLVHAQSTWTGAINSTWSNAGNWSGGVPNSPTAVAIIGPTAFATITVDIPVTLQELQLATSEEFFGNTITFSASGGQILVVSGMQPKFNNDLAFQGSAAITLGDSSTRLTFANLSGPGSYTQSGPGTVVVNDTLGLAGPVTVNAGGLEIGTASGTSDLAVVAGASLKTLTSTWGSLSGGGSIDTNSSPITFNQTTDTTFSGTLTVNQALTKTGAGKLVLSGTTSVLRTDVSGGTLQYGDGTSGILSNSDATANGTLILNLPGNATVSNLDGTGNVVVKSGSVFGTWIYNGDVTVDGGTLNARVIGTGDMTVNAPGVWATTSSNQVGSLAGSGTITLNGSMDFGSNGASTTFTGTISPSGASVLVRKVGTGTLTLTNVMTTVDPFTVAGGTLLSQGATFTQGVNVDTGTTFGGYGTISAGKVLFTSTGSTLAPSGGALNALGQITLQGPYVVKIDGPTFGTGYGRVATSGPFSMFPPNAGPLVLTGSYVPVIGDSFTIFDNTTPSGSGGAFPFPGAAGTIFTLNGVPLKISYTGGTGNDWVLTVATQTVTSSSPSGNGLIAPSGAQPILLGSTATFTLTPALHFHVSSVTGTCPAGTLTGNSYTTGAITSDCTVIADFALDQYTITIDPTTNGTIALIGTQPVNWGETRQFTVTPATGYHINTVTGCGGSLVGNSYTTAAITANCTVTATFAINQYTITIDPTTNGTIALIGTQPVNHGDTRQFTLAPATGYHANTVTGCGGSLVGNTYTTGPITGDCTVTASFAINKYNVTSSGGANGTITPNGPPMVDHGTTTSFTVTPDPGYVASASGCGGSLSGSTYTTGPITADCNVSATFLPLVVYNVVLEGWQQSPYVVTGGSGTATATFNPVTNELTVDLAYSGLSSAETMAHIHGPAARGANAGVLIDLYPPTTSPRTKVVTLTAPQVTMLQNGQLYINVHTVNFGGGEIRGQIDAVGAVPVTGLLVGPTGTGSGTITGTTEAGTVIDCGVDCSEMIPVGKSVTLTATPNANSTFAGWGSPCGGTGQCVFAKGAAGESIAATFMLMQHTVTPAAVVNGTISPNTPQTVFHGTTTPFTVTPATGYHIDTVTGCGGSLAGSTYTTGAITADCTVTATFAINTYTVTPSAGLHGTISPNTPQTVNHNASAQFTVTPDAGYAATVGGTCGGFMGGNNTFTTGAVTHDCTVSATFVALVVYNVVLEGWQQVAPYVVTPAAGSGTATYNPVAHTLKLNLTYSGLGSAETAAHVHGAGARGANAGILYPLAAGSPKTDEITLFPNEETMLANGQLYVNIHTTNNPSGEIRGQLDNAGATTLRALTVIKSGSGAGTVTATTEAGTVIDCGSDCTESIPDGKSVTLTATPTGGSTFARWGQACTGTVGNSCVLAMSAARNVVAVFDPPATAQSADLELQQQVTPNPAATGRDMVATVTLINHGPASATSAELQYGPVNGATYIWSSPGCSLSPVTGSVTCSAGTLAVNATATFRIVFRPAVAGNSRPLAGAAASESDPNSNNSSASVDLNVNSSPPGTPIQRYRLYSDVTKEHHFTTDLNEYNVLGTYVGTWVQEGTVGKILDNPGPFGGVESVPYYRLYDNSTRWHHWTTDPNEYYTLGYVYSGWNLEGVDGWILPSQVAGTTQLYRLNYPALGSLHHWTIDANEYTTLINSFGWIGEPGAGFVVQ